MLRVRIKTPVPEYCIAKNYPNSVLRLRCVCNGKRGIKALVDLKKRDGKTILVIDEHKCPLAQKILDTGAIVTSADVSNRDVIWNIVCSEKSFQKLMDYVECELISKERFSDVDAVTQREYEMLRFAFERGFFESPKGIRLDEIADTFGFSKSTVSETLRRGLKKVLKMYFEFY
ncbi:helix-turn-helix domain-containing protein [Archaeoglobus sp.]